MVFKRRRFRRQGKKKIGVAGKVARLSKMVRHIRQPLNTYQVTWGPIDTWDNVTYTTNRYQLNLEPAIGGTAAGPTSLNFGEGNTNFRYKISAISLDIKFSMTAVPGNNGVAYTYRVLIINNKNGGAYNPTWSGSTGRNFAFLDAIQSAGAGTQSMATVARKNPEMGNAEIEIIFDRTLTIQPLALEKLMHIRVPSKKLNKISSDERVDNATPATFAVGTNTYQMFIVADKPQANSTAGANDAVHRGSLRVDYRTC